MEEDSRRGFIKKTSLLAGGFGLWQSLPASIQKALQINPAKGSTFEDAEHIVLLMQENRSFDHCFGSLQGVRGFDDPRAIRLPNGNPVWLQTNKEGKTYAPFHLDIKDTKITWMGGLPHTWENQVDARNNGQYDKWLDAKRTGYKGFEDKPMTLGYYKREDIPFNYAMADAFTVCDQHFCSSLTGTTPNRLYFFSGALRKDASPDAPALVRNEEIDFKDLEPDWETFPELLEQNNISWKVYQNEISTGSTLGDSEDFWLGNFTDNSLEWFQKYHVKRSQKYLDYLKTSIQKITESIATIEKDVNLARNATLQKKCSREKKRLENLQSQLEKCQSALQQPISPLEAALRAKAFATNDFDNDFHTIEKVKYEDNGTERTMDVPKSDVLANFRQDVQSGNLPAVSWLVAPQAFSDHPSAPWFGAWYVSEVLDILTENPEIWKKTVFILTYDENDGYFDHVPPFVAPDVRDASTGMVSSRIKQASAEFVTSEDELERKKVSVRSSRESPIGLGYRVPFIVASPWSRGGYVNSQVCDHTSVGQFLEKFISRQTGKSIHSKNITDWRRAVCGDLASVFRPYNGEKIPQPDFLDRNAYLQRIDEAKYKPVPSGIDALSDAAIGQWRNNPTLKTFKQEHGTRPSNPLPYELIVNGRMAANRKSFRLEMAAATTIFKERSAGAAFIVYARLPYGKDKALGRNWNFTVAAGDVLEYDFPSADFDKGKYHFEVYGPNGYYREFKGDAGQSDIFVSLQPQVLKENKFGNVLLAVQNNSSSNTTIIIKDASYGRPTVEKNILPNSSQKISLSLDASSGWYDILFYRKNNPKNSIRFAGRTENGKESITDLLIGK